MNNKLATFSAIILTTLTPVAAFAGPKEHTDIARVTQVQPIYTRIEQRKPQEQCWVETVREERPYRRSGTATLIGGIIGGVIGNELGKGGDNKKIGSVVGSALGMSIAKDISRKKHQGGHHEQRYRDIERCETTYHIEQKKVLEGYDVSYRYNNREYTTFMQEHPGKKIRVAVDVRPIDTGKYEY